MNTSGSRRFRLTDGHRQGGSSPQLLLAALLHWRDEVAKKNITLIPYSLGFRKPLLALISCRLVGRRWTRNRMASLLVLCPNKWLLSWSAYVSIMGMLTENYRPAEAGHKKHHLEPCRKKTGSPQQPSWSKVGASLNFKFSFPVLVVSCWLAHSGI